MTPKPTPPIAAIKPHDITTHNHTRTDNYYWLREKENPEVIAYLEAENDYMQAMTAHTTDLQQTLYDEMVGRIQETDSSAPIKYGDFYYYTRTVAGQQYKIHCRKQGSLDAAEEVLLDENRLADGEDYFRIGVTRISPDHTLFAYSTDTSGGEHYTIFVKNLVTGELLPDQIPNTIYSLEWANDNRSLFYTIQDDAWREYKLFRHTLGDDPAQDPELYHEPNELFNIGLDKTKDHAYIILNVVSKETSEVRILDANQPNQEFQLVQPRQTGMRYFVEHRTGQFYILTNDDAPNYKIMTAPVSNSSFANWQAFIPHNPDKLIEGFELFTDHIIMALWDFA